MFLVSNFLIVEQMMTNRLIVIILICAFLEKIMSSHCQTSADASVPPLHQDISSTATALPSEDSNIKFSIRNVVCNYVLPMHIDLRKVALNSWNCEYERSSSVLMKRLRNPQCLIKIFNSGKVFIVGCKTYVFIYF